MPPTSSRSGPALLVTLATAIAGYVPAAATYETATSWARPMRHAEEAMGRGLETIFIGGPIGAILLAGALGWLTHRQALPIWLAGALIAGLAVTSLGIARGNFF